MLFYTLIAFDKFDYHFYIWFFGKTRTFCFTISLTKKEPWLLSTSIVYLFTRKITSRNWNFILLRNIADINIFIFCLFIIILYENEIFLYFWLFLYKIEENLFILCDVKRNQTKNIQLSFQKHLNTLVYVRWTHKASWKSPEKGPSGRKEQIFSKIVSVAAFWQF